MRASSIFYCATSIARGGGAITTPPPQIKRRPCHTIRSTVLQGSRAFVQRTFVQLKYYKTKIPNRKCNYIKFFFTATNICCWIMRRPKVLIENVIKFFSTKNICCTMDNEKRNKIRLKLIIKQKKNSFTR
jgi:hypothetical protein